MVQLTQSSDGRTKPLNIWAMQSTVYIQWKDEKVVQLVACRMRMDWSKRQTGSDKLSFSHWASCFDSKNSHLLWNKLSVLNLLPNWGGKGHDFKYFAKHFITVLYGKKLAKDNLRSAHCLLQSTGMIWLVREDHRGDWFWWQEDERQDSC